MNITTLTKATKEQLDILYPTNGDGAWSIDYVKECLQGQHLDTFNYAKVLLCASMSHRIR